jgi:hypothetical protein
MFKKEASGETVNKLSEAAELKKMLTKRADFGITTSEEMSPSQAALMFGVSGRVFGESAITVVPRGDQVEVTIGPDKGRHLDNLAGWLKENRAGGPRLMKEGYELLFSAGQASVNPSVNFGKIIESKGNKKIEILERIVPEIGEIKRHLEQGGKVQDLIREDKDYWGGLVYACYQNLQRRDQGELKSKGMIPKNMFQTSNE